MANNNGVIKVALTNLGKYNEGELVFTWLELPATDEEITAAFEEIGVKDGTEYEEHFITDYEAPFTIEEYASISTLNEKAELLERLPSIVSLTAGNYSAEEVINLAHELEDEGLISDPYEYTGDIVSDEELDEMVVRVAEEGGWQRVKYFLRQITYLNDEYYRIDGYGNACDLDHEYLEAVVSDMLGEAGLDSI